MISYSIAEYKDLLNLPLLELIQQANRLRKENIGDNNIELCSIINAKSGLCPQDCKFCAQSKRHKTDAPVYPLKDKSEIIEEAYKSKKNNAAKFGIVTSGNVLSNKDFDRIVETVAAIKEKVGIDVCASLGSINYEKLVILKDAGLSRYHHNIETSEKFFPRIVTTHTFADKLRTIDAVKEAGLELCCGGIIGMGETWGDRLDMALLLKKVSPHSIPINILVPIKGTKLENIVPLSPVDAIRTLALFRIILPSKIIKLAAARESILKDFQALAFLSGINGMIIGGYLTIKGREVAEDLKLVSFIKSLWMQ
ncbi:MAG: biotin synthase BioB [Candidatus Hydrogenedentota bacterium]